MLSVFVNLLSNLLTRLVHNTLGISKSTYSWDFHNFDAASFKQFHKEAIYSEVQGLHCWDLVNGQTSSPYIKTGMHLLTNNYYCITTSSLAARPTFQKLRLRRDKTIFGVVKITSKHMWARNKYA